MSEPVEERSPCAESATAEVRYITGDVRSVMRSLPDGSVDLVLSSPPFLGLRSYLPADDPDKALEIGSESTPGEFIDTLLDIVEECRRVLAPHGTLCFELGDTYAGSGGAGGDYGAEGMRGGQQKFTGSALMHRKNKVLREDGNRLQQGDGWPLDKSLCLIPESLRWAMVYGRNPFTGRETPRWRARNVVRWCRPNPPVGALADKVRPATSDIIVACTGRSRYFDLDGIREPSDYDRPNLRGNGSRGPGETVPGQKKNGSDHTVNPAGAPPLDHWWYDDSFDQDAWMVSTEPYHGSHYATWPTKLLVRPIVAMCPSKVCTVCGKPSERITETLNGTGKAFIRNRSMADRKDAPTKSTDQPDVSERITTGWSDVSERITTGWSDCGHDSWRAGVVLDPFAGSGTTLAVAHGHGRSAIGIDLDARNADLARERVGMWLITSTHNDPAVAS